MPLSHRQCKQQHLSLASIRSILYIYIYVCRNGRPTLVRLCLFLFLLSFVVLITIVDALVENMHARFDQQKDDNELFISSIFHECACDGVSPLLILLLCLPACLSSVSVCLPASPSLSVSVCQHLRPKGKGNTPAFVCLSLSVSPPPPHPHWLT